MRKRLEGSRFDRERSHLQITSTAVFSSKYSLASDDEFLTPNCVTNGQAVMAFSLHGSKWHFHISSSCSAY
jgi:hypothetical protein